jgi:putative flippase GtrA
MNNTSREHRPPWQIVRYLMVGAFNTVFGYSLFAVLNYGLRNLGSYSYLLASLLSNLIAITVAFLGYKWFVFKTKGNYLKEWLRCMSVYGGGVLLTLTGLPILVPLFRRLLVGRPQAAPYLAAAVMAVVVVLGSFFGHKHISFAVSEPARQGNVPDTPLISEDR